MTLEPGVLLYNRYKIVEVLSHGGMGAIYKAYDQSLNVEVAVKENLFTTEEGSRQFRREATILANLRHPNLPRVTDHFVIEGQGQYLVMDFIEGEDLRQRLAREGSLPEEDVIVIGIAICEALSYLYHRQPPILHRDIKPGNIKITPGGQVYLVDFGLAKAIQSGQATTIGAQALTPGFAPPEQYGQGTDLRSDLYALGATLYAALTNTTPEDSLARALNNAQLTPLLKLNPKVSRATAAAVEKAMSVSPDQRYQSAEEFMHALLNANTMARKRASRGQTVLSPAKAASDATVVSSGGVTPAGATVRSGRPITAAIPPAPAAAGRPGWIKWLVIILVALVVIVGVGGVLLAMSGLPQKMLSPSKSSATPLLPTNTVVAALPPTDTRPAPATDTPQPSATAAQPTATLPPSGTATAAAAASPVLAATPPGGGGGQIAFVSNRNEGFQIWLMNSDGSNQVQITHIKEGACQPSWSPDGQRLVIVSPCDGKKDQYPGSSLFIINADGSGKTALSDNTYGEFDPAWSPDGTRIVCTSLRDQSRDRRLRQLYIYNLTDKSVTKLSQNIYESDWEPAWSPDGTQVAYVSDVGNMTRIFVINADGKTPPQRFTRDEFSLAFMPAWSPDGKQMIYAGNSTALPDLIGQKIVDQKTQIASQFVIYKELTPVWNAKYSADGQWILYQGVDQSANTDIYLMSPNGTDVTRLTNDPLLDFQPVWRPAGQ